MEFVNLLGEERSQGGPVHRSAHSHNCAHICRAHGTPRGRELLLELADLFQPDNALGRRDRSPLLHVPQAVCGRHLAHLRPMRFLAFSNRDCDHLSRLSIQKAACLVNDVTQIIY